jgi:xanthosine utilization system XapX-like protein
MPETPSATASTPVRNPWPWVVTILGILAILVGAGAWIAHTVINTPGAAIDKGKELVREVGDQAASVARAFHEGTVRQEFLSRATTLAGTKRLQVATLHQAESFQRSEKDNVAWGMIPLPKVVVLAQAPVEYTYYLDLEGPWEFRQEDKTIVVLAPAITPNTPALDVSALTFYTLEGSIWRDENAARERLRDGLTAALRKRAKENEKLVREVGRKKVAEFVEQWLGEKFGDAKDYKVKVLFPDEVPVVAPTEQPVKPQNQ